MSIGLRGAPLGLLPKTFAALRRTHFADARPALHHPLQRGWAAMDGGRDRD